MITRTDFALIATWIKPGSRVLDLGCGDGSLLAHLQQARGVSGYGIENDDANLLSAIGSGVNIIQSNLEAGLKEIEDGSFDTVILSKTLQAMRRTENVLDEMLRVGREAIVTFPNFGYWKHRAQLALGGRMPVSEDLPYQWYNTPNIHLFTIADFEDYCAQRGWRVVDRMVLGADGRQTVLPNLLGVLALYRFTR
ncbi:MAG: methionine biosynthesis protein MetW [Betaproteobacteria bacterium]|nr:methionine biosynthesis protein MetW [Betaproteobacteria bacterium]